MGRKAKIARLTEDIRANHAVMDELGHKLIAFGGSKANRTDMLDRYAWAVREDERLQQKLALLNGPWWERIGA